jgi:hypothetical protein
LACLLLLVTNGLEFEPKPKIHRDSASLLSRLLPATKHHVPVGFWLEPDSDVVPQIVTEAKKLPKLTQHHVKGHQDGKKHEDDLTLPERRNIDTDRSATKMRHEMPAPASKVIPIPAAPVGVCSPTHHFIPQHPLA